MKEYTKEEVLSILEFSKSKNPKDVLIKWTTNKYNTIYPKDEHGLSVVGIFEHSLTNNSGKEVGKLVVFNYKGVGGGWENDIYKMVEQKYFGYGNPYYSTRPDGFDAGYYRLFLVGDEVLGDEVFEEWERPTKSNKFRIYKQELPNSEFIIHYDFSDKRIGSEHAKKLGKDRNYEHYWDGSACNYFIKNIDGLDYKPSKPIVEERIKNRMSVK